jgi:hypothetical protein
MALTAADARKDFCFRPGYSALRGRSYHGIPCLAATSTRTTEVLAVDGELARVGRN